MEDEKKYLQTVFEANEYPLDLVQKTLSKCASQGQHLLRVRDEEEENVLSLPYVQDLREDMEKQVKDLHI